MNYKSILAKYLANKLGSLQLQKSEADIESLVELPKDLKLGDLAFPCFQFAKELKKGPPVIAAEIAKLCTDLPGEFSKVNAVGPYLNFFINKAELAADIIPKVLDGSFLAKRPRSGLKTMIEYSQPNTHKAFHVGHTRNVSLGNALVHICEWVGDEVVAANYIGDVGTHIAKCLWQYKESGLRYEDVQGKMSRGEFLGMLYTEADRQLDFTTLTKAPYPHVQTAKILAVKKLNHNDTTYYQVDVETSKGKKTVVTAATGYEVGDIVPYAFVGAKVEGRGRIQIVERFGITSEGMLCAPNEINLGEEANKLYVFPKNTAIGLEVADYFKTTDAKYKSITDEILRRESAVSDTLKKLEKEEPEVHKLWQETRQWSLNDFDEIYKWLDARFDHFFFESEVAAPGKKVVQEYLQKGVFKTDQGAVGVDLSKYELPFFLVLKSDGTGLYSTKDLALAKLKFDKYNIDKSVYIVDVAQSLHFQQVFKTLELMGYERAKNCFHLAYGMVVLPDGKMSSRKGNVILLNQLRTLLKEQIYKDFLFSYEGLWSKEEIEEAIRTISIATIKYGMLNQDNNKNIVFDLKEWTARTGNTGPYLLYAYARTRSILRELESKHGALNVKKADWSLLKHELEEKLLNKMQQFHSVLQKASERYEPQGLCIYLYELSKDFSRMYDQCSVLHAESEELRTSRALLVDACGRIIKTGLGLLGIKTLERM
jgi:arginyl-tRNA synthetase